MESITVTQGDSVNKDYINDDYPVLDSNWEGAWALVSSLGDVADAAIVTLTGNSGFTVIVIGFDVAGLPVGHTAFEVIMQVTTSLLTGTYVKTGLLVPELFPFTFHW